MNGWIRLDRAIQDNFLWQEPEALKLWLHLLMAASLTDKATAFNGKMLTIKRGQLVFGLNAASARLNISVRRLRKYLDWFESDDMIDKQVTNKFSIISITNYAQYQDVGKQTPSKSQATAKQRATTIQVNKEQSIPPTVDEVRAYCDSRSNGIDPEMFIAFYEARGWKIGKDRMKSWKACVVTWEKRRQEQTPTREQSWGVEL
tara:strand:+ start:926 stop:1534 length:609 start_codon:yes stop_codon:yes gene_type:complete